MDDIRQYRPNRSVSKARVLLLGPAGGGKSSFFNSVCSIFRGHVTSQVIRGTTQARFRPHTRFKYAGIDSRTHIGSATFFCGKVNLLKFNLLLHHVLYKGQVRVAQQKTINCVIDDLLQR